MQIKSISSLILNWYNKEKRNLPFRRTNDPYKIWLSEVMLQQTKVNTAIPYYNKWIKRYPSVLSVGNAKLSSLMKIWEGLGYYSRCRNFHKACKIILQHFHGVIPSDFKTLLSLPGVGEYTASAVLSIAFNKPYPVIDVNVKRVLFRLFGLKNFTRYNQARIKNLLNKIIPEQFPGDFNQGLMELGALICTPRKPQCELCPIKLKCIAFNSGDPDQYPIKKARKKVPHHEIVAGIIWRDNRFYIQKRNHNKMLGGLWEFPGGRVEPKESLKKALQRELKKECGICTNIKNKIGTVEHSYSHFSISLHLFQCEESRKKIKNRRNIKWIKPEEIGSFPFPKANHKLFGILDDKGWNV